MKLFLILIASLALSGCETLSLLTMSKVEPAPAAGDVIEAELFYSYKHKNFAISELGLSKEQVKSVEEACFPELDAARKEGREDDLEEQKMMGDGIFLPAAGAMVFDAAVNAVGEHVKGIKEKASQSYSSYIMVPANAFAYANCIVLQRKGADGVRKAGFITQLITDGDQGTYFYLQPVLAWAKNSVALTKCNDNCYWGNNKQGEISMSMAVVAIASVKGASEYNEVHQFGAGAVSITAVPLRGAAIAKKDAIPSDLFAMPPDVSTVKLSVAVTETGKIPADFTKAGEELKAFREAMSPMISTRLKELNTKD
ncbi:hypothetical protein [Pseudomonas sp. SWI44]|uniref:hypothetical protein n=1 Tax=Pseudomonas sp. SWI44 TaxID=2083053 RepID=UPI000CE5F986|nr:hypothetical protein [Pseudomonas sp. SWI44]AVD90402.1 hypothetical protein C4Q26_26085 [Pseudomonas sp. SWI44]